MDILGTDKLPDPRDLLRFREVSRGMCDAVVKTGRPLRMFGVLEAAERGHLSTLKRLHQQGLVQFTSEICEKAASGGHFELLKWAHANGCPWDNPGRPSTGVPLDGNTCVCAASNGHLDILKWVVANGCPWNKWTCVYAAGGGHLEVLKWFRANGCPWHENMCGHAAKGGQIEVLQWAHAN